MNPKTENFNPESDPKLLCTCGNPNCDRRSVDQETLNRAQIARDNVVNAGIEAGFNAIGVAKTFVHWAYRPELPPGHITMWVYS